jgi:hypothetical protein
VVIVMAETYTPHHPGLFEACAVVGDGTLDKWVRMLQHWRVIVRSDCFAPGQAPQLTVLQQLRGENECLEDTRPGRDWSDIENNFIREKASFWTDKQISREMVGRSEIAVRNHRHYLGIPGRRGL